LLIRNRGKEQQRSFGGGILPTAEQHIPMMAEQHYVVGTLPIKSASRTYAGMRRAKKTKHPRIIGK